MRVLSLEISLVVRWLESIRVDRHAILDRLGRNLVVVLVLSLRVWNKTHIIPLDLTLRVGLR